MDKNKRQKRFQQKDRHVHRQLDIYNVHMAPVHPYKESPHYFHKKHALNCGDSHCVMCGNPRKFFGEKTFQERRFECQEMEYE